MSRNLEYRNLSPIERRVALMHIAEVSQRDIARFIDVDQATVGNILQRVHVAKFIVAQHSTFARDLAPAYKDLSEAIEASANRAFEVDKEVMERLYATDVEHKHYVRAMLGAAATAQDILDRAGKRAPTKVVHSFDIEPTALAAIADVLREDDGISRAIDVTPNGAGLGGEVSPEVIPSHDGQTNGNGSH